MLFPFKINVDFLFFYFYKPVYQITNTRRKQHCPFRTIEETIRIRKLYAAVNLNHIFNYQFSSCFQYLFL